MPPAGSDSSPGNEGQGSLNSLLRVEEEREGETGVVHVFFQNVAVFSKPFAAEQNVFRCLSSATAAVGSVGFASSEQI